MRLPYWNTILPKDSSVEICAAHSGRVNSGMIRGPRLRICQDSLARRACRYPGEILFAIGERWRCPARVRAKMGTWTVGQFVVAQKTSVVVLSEVIAECEDGHRSCAGDTR